MNQPRGASAPAAPGLPKARVADLGIFGGHPAFSTALHVGRPNIGDRTALHERIDEILDRAWLTNDGPMVKELERRVAADLGVDHAIAVANATLGLQVAARAAGLSGQVIVPAFTFIATANAFEWLGLEPVFADIDPDRLTLDPDSLERLIGPDTSAVVATHLWGRSAAVEELTTIADRHGVALLFDAAHAYGCERDGRMIGGFGQAEVFSFHATKFVNAFEGGVITTADGSFAERCRRLRNFGFEDWDYTVSGGTNAKMHEASAAMALTSLDSSSGVVAANRQNLERYWADLRDLEGIEMLPPDERGACNDQYVVLRIDGARSPIGRDRLMAVLNAENVLARRYFYPGCHRLAPYVERAKVPRLPVTEAVADEVLVLPTGTAVGASDIDAICGLIRFAHARAAEIDASWDANAEARTSMPT